MSSSSFTLPGSSGSGNDCSRIEVGRAGSGLVYLVSYDLHDNGRLAENPPLYRESSSLGSILKSRPSWMITRSPVTGSSTMRRPLAIKLFFLGSRLAFAASLIRFFSSSPPPESNTSWCSGIFSLLLDTKDAVSASSEPERWLLDLRELRRRKRLKERWCRCFSREF